MEQWSEAGKAGWEAGSGGRGLGAWAWAWAEDEGVGFGEFAEPPDYDGEGTGRVFGDGEDVVDADFVYEVFSAPANALAVACVPGVGVPGPDWGEPGPTGVDCGVDEDGVFDAFHLESAL